MNAKSADSLSGLIEQLASDKPATRETARKELVKRDGPDVTRALVMTLLDPQQHVRWEAAKALQAIADPVAAMALMHAMDDDDGDVRWVAAEGLIALGKEGVLTVLSGLINRSRSVAFRKAAHHVLRETRDCTSQVAPVLQAMEQSEPAVGVPPAAYQAIRSIKGRPGAAST